MVHNYKVAVLYVGQPRSIKKTLKFLKQNVLLTPNVHVFACLQPDGQPDVDGWLKDELQDHLKSIVWFDINNTYESTVKNRLLQHPLFDGEAHNYLKYNGTINSYMQIVEAYKKMWEYEQTNNITYDYIIRHRTDIVLCKKIDFGWMTLTTEQIESRLQKIQSVYKDLSPHDCITYFMNTIIHDDLIDPFLTLGSIQSYLTDIPINQELSTVIKKLLTDNNFILLLYYDFSYIINRSKYYLIPFAGTSYGYMNSTRQHRHWWNSESQLIQTCVHAGLNVFNNGLPYGVPTPDNYSTYFTPENELLDNCLLGLWCKHI